MSLVIHELERIESRVLGALRCVDSSTRVAIDAALQVRIDGARVRRNRSGQYVIVQASALAAHETAFTVPPAAPVPGSVLLTAAVHDPSGRYLPRLAALALPRDPVPANADSPSSLFRPIEVAMYPASIAPLGINWSVLWITLRDALSGDALGGALLTVRSGATVLARGLSDWRGEALVPVPGVPITTWSDEPDAVVVSEIAVQLEVVFDPAAGLRSSADAVLDGREPAVLPLVDPDRLEARRGDLPRTSLDLQLAAGRSQSVSIPLALP